MLSTIIIAALVIAIGIQYYPEFINNIKANMSGSKASSSKLSGSSDSFLDSSFTVSLCICCGFRCAIFIYILYCIMYIVND